MGETLRATGTAAGPAPTGRGDGPPRPAVAASPPPRPGTASAAAAAGARAGGPARPAVRIVMEQSGHALENLGDLAMLRVAVERFRRLFPGCEVGVVVDQPSRLARCVDGVTALTRTGRARAIGTGVLFGRMSRRLGRVDRRLVAAAPNLSRPLVRLRHRVAGRDLREVDGFFGAIRSADLVVATGGGFVTDEFPHMVEEVCDVLAFAQRLGKPTAMLGQGLGPLTRPDLVREAAGALGGLRLLGLREGVGGPGLAARAGVPADRIAVTGDDAIELAHRLRPDALGGALGVNIRVAPYAGARPEDRGAVARWLDGFLADSGARPLVIPIALNPGGDRAVTEELLPDRFPTDPAAVERPEDAIRLAGRCRLVVTGSYHAGVFALSQGVPVVCLVRSSYYAAKFHGLAAQFGDGCECLAMGGPGFEARLGAATRRLWADADRLRPGLLRRAEEQIRSGRAAYERLAEMIG